MAHDPGSKTGNQTGNHRSHPMTQAALNDPATTRVAQAVQVDALVRALEDMGLTQRSIATATGATERSIRNWRTTSAIAPRYDERLRDVRRIVLILDESLTPRGISQWFTARNRLLGQRRPIDAMRDGDTEAVFSAAAALVEGAYI